MMRRMMVASLTVVVAAAGLVAVAGGDDGEPWDDPATKLQHDAAEVMRATDAAMTHIVAARRALERDDVPAAKAALAQSELKLERLYAAPALADVIDELDATIAEVDDHALKVQAAKRAGKEASAAGAHPDLAPLAAMITTRETYLDPQVAAGVKAADRQLRSGEPERAAESLRAARSTMTIDIAYLPVEEAYIRVLAARAALEADRPRHAEKILAGVPVVVAQTQVAAPLVPVRFRLQAAAIAADEGDWDRAEAMIARAAKELGQLQAELAGTPEAPEIDALARDVKRMSQSLTRGQRPSSDRIRELAARTRTIPSA